MIVVVMLLMRRMRMVVENTLDLMNIESIVVGVMQYLPMLV